MRRGGSIKKNTKQSKKPKEKKMTTKQENLKTKLILLKYSRPDCERIVDTPSLRALPKYMAHTSSHPKNTLRKSILFARPGSKYYGNQWCKISKI